MERKISPAFPKSIEQHATPDGHITRRNLFKVMFGGTFCLKEFGLELQFSALTWRKTEGGGNEEEREGERGAESQSHTTHHSATKDRVSALFH